MKLHRFLAMAALAIVLVASCKSAKKSAQDSGRKKDPVAAEAALRIGVMLDKLATALIDATKGKADILRTAEGINIAFQPDFYFESSSDKLTSGARGVLENVSGVLNEYPYTEIFIEGHADSSGNQLNNKKLSENRAKAVALYLKSNGVLAERMAIAGYGATRPVESNATPQGRKKNRRVVVKIRANEKKFLEAKSSVAASK